jgi:hypothetical protein
MYFYQQEGPVYMYTQGMSVIASQNVDQGQFVAQYAGEMLTNGEADRRLAEYDASQAGVGHALLVLHAAGMPAHMHQLALLSLKTSFRITWVCILQLFSWYRLQAAEIGFLKNSWWTGCEGDPSIWHSLPTVQHWCNSHWEYSSLFQSQVTLPSFLIVAYAVNINLQ